MTSSKSQRLMKTFLNEQKVVKPAFIYGQHQPSKPILKKVARKFVEKDQFGSEKLTSSKSLRLMKTYQTVQKVRKSSRDVLDVSNIEKIDAFCQFCHKLAKFPPVNSSSQFDQKSSKNTTSEVKIDILEILEAKEDNLDPSNTEKVHQKSTYRSKMVEFCHYF